MPLASSRHTQQVFHLSRLRDDRTRKTSFCTGTARHDAALGYAENSFRMCVVWLKIKQSAAFGAALNSEQRAYIINCTQLAWPGLGHTKLYIYLDIYIYIYLYTYLLM